MCQSCQSYFYLTVSPAPSTGTVHPAAYTHQTTIQTIVDSIQPTFFIVPSKLEPTASTGMLYYVPMEFQNYYTLSCGQAYSPAPILTQA